MFYCCIIYFVDFSNCNIKISFLNSCGFKRQRGIGEAIAQPTKELVQG